MSFQKIKGKEDIVLYKAQMFDKVYEQLPAGVYQLTDAGGMFEEVPYFKPVVSNESLVNFNSGILSDFISEVGLFFGEKTIAAYNEMQIVHKTGYILYGKPGTGKTCMCLLAMKILVEKYNAVCIDATKTKLQFVKKVIEQVREIQKSPIVLFFDECDEDLTENESSFLPFLDGNESVSGLIFLGCTNYIDRIPARIKNRKSRIKKCFEIKSLPQEVFNQYITSKLPNLAGKIASEFCYKACESELTIDQFKNALIDYKLYENTIDDAIAAAKETYGGDEDKPKPGYFTFTLPKH